ncbi:MAG: aspartate aminotransferase family protein [Bacteroidales bacterium]|nr:aspartate aminotransferase family protein [Bacteroidales bacterium]
MALPDTEKRSAEEIYKQACEVIPGGVSRNTVFHKPHPFYAAHASGCYVTDIDGIQRLDFANNMASLIHGHAHPAIVSAVIEQVQKGTAYTMATEAEVALAQLLCHRVESLEQVRFTNSGTEAVMAMMKAARAFTGRSKIAKAEGAYHGTYDFAEISQAPNPTNWGDIDQPNSVPLAHGTPQGVLDDMIIFPYNDIERTISILNRQADKIAAVIIDPVPHRVGLLPGTEQFIEAIYNWTRENNALLIFDEVVTFRVNYGGAQERYSVKPDMTAMGKIIGGGFPVGAFGGRADIMKVLDPRESKLLFPFSGTFSANPVTVTAGRVAMELFDRDAVLKLNALTQIAIRQIEEAVKLADVPVSLTGAGSMFRIHLTETPPKTFREAYQPKEVSALINEMLDFMYHKEQIMMINTFACMFSTVMTQKEVDKLSEGMLNVFRFIKPKLDALVK